MLSGLEARFFFTQKKLKKKGAEDCRMKLIDSIGTSLGL
jgi:hypothetical protein